jgi:predicted nucleic acid-binding protein
MWARMRVHLAQSGRRLNINDLWIAAVAAARGLPVVTQDDDFGPVEAIGGLEVFGSELVERTSEVNALRG